MSDTLEEVFKKFRCSDLVNAEYKRRAKSRSINKGVRCPNFCVSVQDIRENKTEYSEVHIETYNELTNCFEVTAKIPLGQRSQFDVVLGKDKIFLLGGTVDKILVKTVSRIETDSRGFMIYIFVHCMQMSSYDLSSRKEEVLPELKCARLRSTTIMVGKYIYVLGGATKTTKGCKALASCER